MAHCHICKAETELYECGLPICLACVKKRELDRSHPANEHRSSEAKQRHIATPREHD